MPKRRNKVGKRTDRLKKYGMKVATLKRNHSDYAVVNMMWEASQIAGPLSRSDINALWGGWHKGKKTKR